jgi:hypothetical protein
MAFVRKKSGGNYGGYYQLVESRRVDGQPRQKVLLHLGLHPTVEDALKKWPREIKKLRRDAVQDREGVPESHDSAVGMRTFYRDCLKRADSFDRQADELEKKLARLRDFKATGVVPSTGRLV